MPIASPPARDKGMIASLVPDGFRSCLIGLALMLSGPVLAAGLSCAQPVSAVSGSGLEELDEVVVSGEQVTTNTKDVLAWLARLPGRYIYEGFVDLCGQGVASDQTPVTGVAECRASGSTPNVFCTVDVRWQEARGADGRPLLGGVSHLTPALLTFSLEKRHEPYTGGGEAALRAAISSGRQVTPIRTAYWGLAFTQVDNKGIAEWGSGVLAGDTFIAREPCIGIPGACRKTTRVTARPGDDHLAMVVDVAIDSRRVLHQTFQLRRQPVSGQDANPGEPQR